MITLQDYSSLLKSYNHFHRKSKLFWLTLYHQATMNATRPHRRQCPIGKIPFSKELWNPAIKIAKLDSNNIEKDYLNE
jgi:hypothetical protein